MANVVWNRTPKHDEPTFRVPSLSSIVDQVKIEKYPLRECICLVRSRFGLPEKYVEIIVCPALSETVARVIDRKALTEIGIIATCVFHHCLLSLAAGITCLFANIAIYMGDGICFFEGSRQSRP